MKIEARKTRVFKENENLFSFITSYLPKVSEGSVIVITSKIVALSEGRTAVIKNNKEKDLLIKKESTFALRTELVWLTVKDGTVMANAGIDESNANGKIILLPKDSFKSAVQLHTKLMKHYKIKKLGILITDSRLMPLRAGVVGVALGYAGFSGIKNYVGKKDMFGRKFKFEQTDIADSLATAAVLCMGEGNEQKPLAVITGASIVFTNKLNKNELRIDPKKDLYAPLFKKLK
jgi:coenzyme F420-0:L-glutamate ligase